jgi:hypothetical protein
MLALAAAALAIGGQAWGQERVIEKGVVKQTKTESRTTNRITTLMKSHVVLKEGEKAGTIVDFVISDHGCIEYLVAEEDDGYYVIPYSAARVDYEQHTVTLGVTTQEFRNVMRFRSSEWPDLRDDAIQQRVFKFWGVKSTRPSGTFEERRSAKPITPGARTDDDGRDRPEARDPKTPARDPKSPAPRDPKSPAPRDPKSPAPREPGVEPRDPSPRPSPDAEPRPRPRPDAEPRPKPRADNEPRPQPNPPKETPEPKKPPTEKP